MIRVALFSTILGVEKTDQCPAYSGHLRSFVLNSAEEAELREAAWVLEALLGVCGWSPWESIAGP